MEQIYRRRGEYVPARNRRNETESVGSYKCAMLKQAVLCLLLFIVALFIKVSPKPELDTARNGIKQLVNSQTDFTALPAQIAEWFQTNILHKEGSETVRGGEVLTTMQLPVSGTLSSGFGLRSHPTDGVEKFHYGVDIAADEGKKIQCAATGAAVEVGESPDYGNYILVQHEEDIYTLYAHCQQVLPQVGDKIEAGQVIATVGMSGNATGPHLHFEIRSGSTWLDPADFITLPSAS